MFLQKENMTETLQKVIETTIRSFKGCCISPPESVEREKSDFLASMKDEAAHAEFEAIIADKQLNAFLTIVGLDCQNFKASTSRYSYPYLHLITREGTEHLRVQDALDVMGIKVNQPLFCGNATQMTKIGDVYITFFPRYGEIHFSLHNKQSKPIK